MNSTASALKPNRSSDFRRAMLDGINPFPKGWFLLCFADEVAKGQIINRTFMGKEIVVFRTQSGQVSVLDAYCTHMGAHFGYGGTVVGETIKCPFHGYCFNTNGKCVQSSLKDVPQAEKVKDWEVRELNGLILVFHNPFIDNIPDWEIDALDTEGWSALEHHEFVIKSHPQEIAENSIDVSHLSEVHGYNRVELVQAIKTEGTSLGARYQLSEPTGLLSKFDKSVRVDVNIRQIGLGYGLVTASIANYGLQNRLFVCATPIDGDSVYLRIAMSVKRSGKKQIPNAILKLFPQKMLQRHILNSSLKNHIQDIEQDYRIWDNKININHGHSTDSDSPVLQFRSWARQFS